MARPISYRSAAILFTLGTVLYASNSTLLVLSKGGDTHIKFHLSAVVLFAELFRLFGALCLVFTFGYTTELSQFFHRKMFSFALPAFIYAINDEIAFLCMEHMDSATFQTLSNFKILTTSTLCYFFLGHKVSKRQWLALGILTVATIGGALSNTVTSSGSSIDRHAMSSHHTHHHHHFKRIVRPLDNIASSRIAISNHHLQPPQPLQPPPPPRRLFVDRSKYKYSYANHHRAAATTAASAAVSSAADAAATSTTASNNQLGPTNRTEEAFESIAVDALDTAIAEHRFFITKEGILLIVLYSVLSAIAAAYSEWLLRSPSKASSTNSTTIERDKGHGEFSTPAVASPSVPLATTTASLASAGKDGVYRSWMMDLEKVTHRRLASSPSSGTFGSVSASASASSPFSSSSTSTVLPFPMVAPHQEHDIETPPHGRGTRTGSQVVGRRGSGSTHRFFLAREGSESEESLPTKMVRIYFWGILFSVFHCAIEISWQFEQYGTQSTLLDGFNFYTWVLICNQALMGLVLTAIIHQMGAISKLFLLSVAMILTSIVTIFAFHLIPNFWFCVSFACIVGSILLYNHEEFFNESTDHHNGNSSSQSQSSSYTPIEAMKQSMARVANKLYAYMFAAMILFVLGGGVAASLSIHDQFENKNGLH